MDEALTFAMGKYKARLPAGLRYTKNHLWFDGRKMGLTSYKQRFFMDITDIRFRLGPGDRFLNGSVIAVIEGMKAAEQVLSDISGRVLGLNGELSKDPSLINSAPYDAGWIMEVEDAAGDTLSAQEYKEHIESDWRETVERVVKQRSEYRSSHE